VKAAPVPEHEAQRLEALRRYSVVDTPPEEAFDELTRLACHLCAAPISFITFIDENRQWVKSAEGLQVADVPLEISFAAHSILHQQFFVVEDATRDDRFVNHPYVRGHPHVRFFAGASLITPEGHTIGTLCVLDTRVRQLTPEQAEGLRILSHQVMTQLELRRNVLELARSVDEHQRTEDRLRNSETFYQTLVDTLPQNILRKDTQGRFTFANKRFCHSIGKPLNEIIGKTDADFFPRELASKYQRDDERVMRTLENLDTTEAHVTSQAGKIFVHVLKTPLYDALGRVVGIQGIFWDVTQRKKIEEQLAYERDLLRALLDNIPDRIYFKDVESRFLRCSKSMAERLGLAEPGEVIGKTDFNFHTQELAQEFFQDEQRILLTGQPLINKLERQFDKHGQEMWASVTKVPIYNTHGTVTGIIGISRDVTQLKLAEAALEHARDVALESARFKSEFLANMSHEIRTPMNAITGMTGLLLDTQLTPEQQEFVATIRGSTEALLSIINDILDFSKIEAGKLSLEVIDFELRDAVESTVEMLAEQAQKKNLDLNCWFAADVPNCLRGDPGRIRQVLANLLTNAVKFTARGDVFLSVAKVRETADEVVLRFEVKDTGVGISPEALNRIFKAFIQADGSTTRKYGGTGLGLTISKQLVEMMRGEIGVESKLGEGSLFWFQIPLAKQSVEAQQEDEFAAGDLRGLRVLVVDDSKAQCRILREQLERWGLKVLCPEGGENALQLLRDEAAASRPIRVLISDLEDPRMDGLTLAQRVRETPALVGTRLLMLTTLGHRLSAPMLQTTGIAACLMKPVRQSRLFDTLVNIMSGRTDSRAAGAGSSVLPLENRPHLRVLLAEDNIVNQRLALRQLKKLGYHADAVANGNEVLQALAQIPYDVILMDCHMPELDGYKAAQKIRETEQQAIGGLKSSPYIIALTANALQGDRERCLAVGMNDYLTKPVSLAGLQDVLQRAQLKVVTARSAVQAPAAVLDARTIAGLRELQTPGEPDALTELVKLFAQDGHKRLAKMAQAFESSDSSALANHAHTLKGSANNMGARDLAALCAQLEKSAKMGDLTEAANLLLNLRSAFEQVEQALMGEVRSQSPSA
jgi:PAS domain S-box-containing protein